MARTSNSQPWSSPRPDSVAGQPDASRPPLEIVGSRAPEAAADHNRASDADFAVGITQLRERATVLELSTEEVLDAAARLAHEFTGSSGAAIALGEGGLAVCRARAGFIAPSVGTELTSGAGLSGDCLRSGQVHCCDDTENDPRVVVSASRALGARSILVVPIRRRKQVIGILEVFSSRVGAFGTSELQRMQVLAGIVSDGLEAIERCARQSAQCSSVSARAETNYQSAGEPASRDQAEQHGASDHTGADQPAQSVAELSVNDCFSPPAIEAEPGLRCRAARMAAMLALGCAVVIVLLVIGYWMVAQHGNKPPKSAAPGEGTRTASETAVQNVGRNGAVSPNSGGIADGRPVPLLGVKANSARDFTALALSLEAPVTYNSGRLGSPERVFFDLANARISPELTRGKAVTFTVGDKYVARVRIAQVGGHHVRVVVDMNCRCDYAAVMSSAFPARLMVEIHPSGTPGTMKAADLSTNRASAHSSRPGAAHADAAESIAGSSVPLRIVIDPGHGGSDTGTVGQGGLQEKEVVLDVAQRVGSLLRQRLGAEVVYTRTADQFVPLESRGALANAAHGDLFVSIHANSSDVRTVNGIETFYMDPSSAGRVHNASRDTRALVAVKISESRRFAGAVQQALYSRLAAHSRMRDRGLKAAPLVVLIDANMPAILSEIAFMSSPKEERELRGSSYRQEVAEALFVGIKAYATRTRQRAGRLRRSLTSDSPSRSVTGSIEISGSGSR